MTPEQIQHVMDVWKKVRENRKPPAKKMRTNYKCGMRITMRRGQWMVIDGWRIIARSFDLKEILFHHPNSIIENRG